MQVGGVVTHVVGGAEVTGVGVETGGVDVLDEPEPTGSVPGLVPVTIGEPGETG